MSVVIYLYYRLFLRTVEEEKVKSIEKSNDEPRENFKSYALRISPVKVENNKYVCVTATFDSAELYEELKIYKGRNILIFGLYANSKISKNKSNIEFLNINIRIYGKNQVLLIERE